ncbi:MAG: hypothetical protein Q8M54_00740 [Desulfobaccales bacterium]|nr:hypothetical protein [Desulfobaccales bacterium]
MNLTLSVFHYSLPLVVPLVLAEIGTNENATMAARDRTTEMRRLSWIKESRKRLVRVGG